MTTTTSFLSATTTATDSNHLDTVINAQLTSLDDTDCYASAWSDALQQSHVSWGGRGKGGRGLARRTVQPQHVVVEDVRLEYVSDDGLPGKVLLEGATLKLLSSRVYSLVGRNGCGKSTLLRRIHAGKIPGFPPHLSTVYIPQEVIPQATLTPLEIVLKHHDQFFEQSAEANQLRIQQLEDQLESLDISLDENTEKVEELCQKISVLEEEVEGGRDVEKVRKQAQHVLSFFGVDESDWHVPSAQLSGGVRKKIILASALFCKCDLLLLDEPTNYLDIKGLIQLRRLIEECTKRHTTVLMVSHDVDLINDMATDVIHFVGQSLLYYPGNYRDFVRYKTQQETHRLRQNNALEKKREGMLQTIENIKKQPAGKRGGAAKKKARAIENRKKKLERHGLEKDEKGHRFSAQKAGTGIREGSINSMDASTRNKLSHTQLLKRADASLLVVPDKAVQFVFRNNTSTWGEPLIMLTDVGDGYGEVANHSDKPDECSSPSMSGRITKKDGMLFDWVDLCIDEGSTTCILGANGSGKTTLMHILAKQRQPREGKVHYANNVTIAYFDQHVVDEMIESNSHSKEITTALSLLAEKFPTKQEQELRGELTNFGLNPKQASTNIQFLSGGERGRLCLATLMLDNPQVLILDEPTSHMDIESVEALVYGLKKWNGTVVMVSHDANLVRTLGGDCYVILEEEGKLCRIRGGIDSYLKTFTL